MYWLNFNIMLDDQGNLSLVILLVTRPLNLLLLVILLVTRPLNLLLLCVVIPGRSSDSVMPNHDGWYGKSFCVHVSCLL